MDREMRKALTNFLTQKIIRKINEIFYEQGTNNCLECFLEASKLSSSWNLIDPRTFLVHPLSSSARGNFPPVARNSIIRDAGLCQSSPNPHGEL